MAFQQPQQRPQLPRHPSPYNQTTETPATASPIHKRTVEESQEWILFSPAQHEQQSSHTSQTPRTATHLSDFGSLETHIRSQPPEDRHDGEHLDPDAEGADDGAELDSLDDGLHAFHHHPFSAPSNNLDVSGGTVLPTHDGFGGFPSSAGLQQHLWQFERYNPQRSKHAGLRSEVQKQLDAMEEEREYDVEDDRTARIERWRLEQSRVVLDEIEKETRRRRTRRNRLSATASPSVDLRSSIRESVAGETAHRHQCVIQEEQGPESAKGADQHPESFWQRITRRVIRDLIGLDETTLSVIFGESLPEDPSPTPKQPSPIAAAVAAEARRSRVSFNDSGYSWEVKLLEHIARELGMLVNQFTEYDGRAFTTYLRGQSDSQLASTPTRDGPQPRQPSLRQRRKASTPAERQQASPIDHMFSPTLPNEGVDTSLWGIEEEPDDFLTQETSAQQQQDRDYWERDVDVAMIFSYLKRRFASHVSPSPEPAEAAAPPASSSQQGPLPSSWATFSSAAAAQRPTPESLRRAEAIRRQHPLISRATERAAAQTRRRESLLRRLQSPGAIATAQKRPGSSSCASQSTKRSRHSRSGSSRHFWDLGGSLESVGSGGAPGGWGEV
ncbi:hypothetical protein BDY17DRAFT_2665 [Neohortaea acidophila]|uniref:Uncharacterized protein n=1 Tax=Neohortaea acidophila TaxID=245834 RepID=A0A6A6Q442_9PEZI|nr:uncharacterized protein BDY17DRAFT_2665 [Neohortaea acidophila]KAF2487065.1 hypothetical protein BDY17DRAFT_2665 [Neohortaea acidophila]